MRAVLILLIAAMLAGCSGTSDDPQSTDTEGDHEGDPGDDATNEGHDEDEDTEDNVTIEKNTAPAGALDVVTDQLSATFAVNVSDADGDAVSWMLDANGNGTADLNGTENGTVTFDYAVDGTYNASLTVFDGTNATVVTLEVTVSSVQPQPGQSETVTWPAGSLAPGCLGDIVGVPFVEQADGVFYQSFAIEPHTFGYSYTTNIGSTGVQGGDVGLAFLKSDWSTISSGFVSSTGTGTVPQDAAYGVFWSCYYVGNTGTFTSTPA